MKRTSDVVIVGGGLMGCSTAFHLARDGVDVTVLERDSVGLGATGRSSAIIRQHYSNELTARMALHSLHVFEDFDERVGGECGFTRTGFLVIVGGEDRAGMEANIALQREVGIETGLLSPEELAGVMPGLETGDLACAAFEPKSGYADPHMTVNGYADAARRLGATILVGREVTGIRFSGDRVVGVDTSDGGFDAPIVVNCAGPWGAAVAAMAGVGAPIVSSRVQVATFQRPTEFEAPHPIVIDFVHGTYFRSETGRLTLVGSVDPSEADDVVDPDAYAEHVEPEFVAEVGEAFAQRYPPMEGALSTGGFAGLYAVTPDWHPIIDEVPAGSGHYLCTGFSGHGFKLAPAVGLMTADLVTGVAEPEFPTDLFRLSRFAEDDPVRGRYAYSITG
jgi:glycine/D-amino acid oxidase-like deaminating enzyme